MVTNRDRKLFGSRRKSSKICLDDWLVDIFDPCSDILGPTSRRASHVQTLMNDGPNPSREIPSCSAIDLAEIRRSSKIIS